MCVRETERVHISLLLVVLRQESPAKGGQGDMLVVYARRVFPVVKCRRALRWFVVVVVVVVGAGSRWSLAQ